MKMNESNIWDLEGFLARELVSDIAHYICGTMMSDESKITCISERLRIAGLIREDWNE